MKPWTVRPGFLKVNFWEMLEPNWTRYKPDILPVVQPKASKYRRANTEVLQRLERNKLIAISHIHKVVNSNNSTLRRCSQVRNTKVCDHL